MIKDRKVTQESDYIPMAKQYANRNKKSMMELFSGLVDRLAKDENLEALENINTVLTCDSAQALTEMFEYQARK